MWFVYYWGRNLFLCLIIYEYSIICIIIMLNTICIIIIDETNPKSTYTCVLHSQPRSDQIRTHTKHDSPEGCPGYIIFSRSKNCYIFHCKICSSSWWSYNCISLKFNFYLRPYLLKSIILSRYQQICRRFFISRWRLPLFHLHC